MKVVQLTYTCELVGNAGKFRDLIDLYDMSHLAAAETLKLYKSHVRLYRTKNERLKVAYDFVRMAYPKIPSKVAQNLVRKVHDSTLAVSERKLNRTKRMYVPLCYDKQMIDLQRRNNTWMYWIRIPVLGHRHKQGCDYHSYALSGKWPSNKIASADSVDYIEIHRRWHKRKRQHIYYVHITVSYRVNAVSIFIATLGIDFNVNNITLSDGKVFSLRKYQHMKRMHRQKLAKSNGPQLMKDRRDNMHESKNLIHKLTTEFADHVAAKTVYTLAVAEDLKYIRKSSSRRYGKSKGREFNKLLHNSFPFGQFQTLLKYKLQLRGLDLATVSAAYTSQECNICGHISKRSRKSQSRFDCAACGSKLNADSNASANIQHRGLALPNISERSIRNRHANQ